MFACCPAIHSKHPLANDFSASEPGFPLTTAGFDDITAGFRSKLCPFLRAWINVSICCCGELEKVTVGLM